MEKTSCDKPYMKKCKIKRLDFENCVVSGFRNRANGKRKLRARIVRDLNKTPKQEKDGSDTSPVLLKIPMAPKQESSLVLSRRNLNCDSSPVLFCKNEYSPVFGTDSKSLISFRSKRKINIEEQGEESCTDESTFAPLRKSPVFKIKTLELDQHCLLKKNNKTIFAERLKDECVSSGHNTSLQIEDFSQDLEPSLNISSVESQNLETITSQDCSFTNNGDIFNKALPKPLNQGTPSCRRILFKTEKVESITEHFLTSKRSTKKNSLLSRLHLILRKQASEKSLWQHQKSNNGQESNVEKVSVIDFWYVNANYVIKCCRDQLFSTGDEIIYVVIDSRWIPSVKVGCTILVHPPWQKLCIGEIQTTTVLLNLISVEILDDVNLLPSSNFKTEPVPYLDEISIFDSLFSYHNSPLLF